MEKDDEMGKGDGNSYTTEYRQYDPRLGRWLSIDPVTHAFQSPYCAFDNDPINIIDPSGADGEEQEVASSSSSSMTTSEDFSGNSVTNFTTNTTNVTYNPNSNVFTTTSTTESTTYFTSAVDGSMQSCSSIDITTTKTEPGSYMDGFNSNASNSSDFYGGVYATMYDMLDNPISTINKSMRGLANATRNMVSPGAYAKGAKSFYNYATLPAYGRGRADSRNVENFAHGLLTTAPLAFVGGNALAFGRSFSLFGANAGYGYSLGRVELFYKNSNVSGGTIFSYKSSSRIFRMDFHEVKRTSGVSNMVHYHKAKRLPDMSNRKFKKLGKVHYDFRFREIEVVK